MTIQDQLSALLRQALSDAQAEGALPAFAIPDEISIQRPKAGYGDFASPVAMALARFAKQAPLQLAQTIAQHLPQNGLIGKVEVAPPGFINLWVSSAWMTGQVERILQAGEQFGNTDYAQGQRAQVEFVSANPTGPLTIGHGRNAVLGDTLARLFEAVGYEVTREYYYNDGGRQMELLGESVRARYLQLLGREVEWSADYYQGDYIIEIAQAILNQYGDSLANETMAPFRQFAMDNIMEEQKATLASLGIRFDVYFREQSLTTSGEVWEVVKALRQADVAYDAEGATWIRMTQFGGDKDRVLVRSNGEPTYTLPDIAYHANKFNRAFDFMINVLGADHAAQHPMVAAALKTLGYDTRKLQVVDYQFVTLMRDGVEVRMSKRAGNFVTLDELIKEVGPDVVRYFLLMRAVNTHVEFDMNLAVKQSDDNPVYYVQYAHTRIAGVLRQAAERGIDLDPQADVTVLSDPSELALIREMLRLEEVIVLAAKQLAPHHLCYYATDLATTFHTFYDRCPVLPPKQTDPALTQARLKLCAAAKQTLARTLNLIGVSAPERM